MSTLFDPITSWLKKRRLETQKRNLLKKVPKSKVRKFNQLYQEIKKGNGTRERRKKLLKVRRELEEMGLMIVVEKIKKINKQIQEI